MTHNHNSGPFGNYDRLSTGHILNALHFVGVPLSTIENWSVGSETINTRNNHTLENRVDVRYKYFDGIELPLFLFSNKLHDVNKRFAVTEDGKQYLKYKFHLKLSPDLTPALIIEKVDASPELHQFLKDTLTIYNCDPWYKVRTNAGAFFQGGADDPNGDWFYIEFWNPEGAQAYIDKLNAEFKLEVKDV